MGCTVMDFVKKSLSSNSLAGIWNSNSDYFSNLFFFVWLNLCGVKFQMVKGAQFAKFQMEQLGLFKAVSINVDVSKGMGSRFCLNSATVMNAPPCWAKVLNKGNTVPTGKKLNHAIDAITNINIFHVEFQLLRWLQI